VLRMLLLKHVRDWSYETQLFRSLWLLTLDGAETGHRLTPAMAMNRS
jgi:hypothetical protein